MRKRYKVYRVIGGNRSEFELILTTSKKRALEITNIREMGTPTVDIIIDNPIIKKATNSYNEDLDFVNILDSNYKNIPNVVIDSEIYDDSPLELITVEKENRNTMKKTKSRRR